MLKHHLPLLLVLLALAGCRTNPACERQVGLMRTELLALEDKYYLLEAKYQEAVGQSSSSVDGCDTTGQPIPPSKTPSTVNPSRPSDSDIQIQLDPKDSSNSTEPQAAPIAAEFDARAAHSVVTFQTPTRFAKNQNRQPAASSDDHQESVISSSVDEQASRGARPPSAPAEFGDAQALREPLEISGRAESPNSLLVDPTYLRAHDDGLSLVVQVPDDRWSATGSLSISVIDPNEVAERQRIGLWRFAPEEIVNLVERRVDAASIAIPLELSWNQHPPTHSDLVLFVRWEHPQFPALEISQPFSIATDSSSPNLVPAGVQEEIPEDRVAERQPEEFTASGNSELPPNTPQWRPNR